MTPGDLLEQNPSLVRLAAAAEKLEPVLDQMAFVGGSVTGLVLPDPAAAAVRPTLDLDAMMAIDSCVEFTRLVNRARDLGLSQPHTEATPICRWAIGGLILDLMPTDNSILGISSRWYSLAGEGGENQDWWSEIRVIPAAYFLLPGGKRFTRAAKTISAGAAIWKI